MERDKISTKKGDNQQMTNTYIKNEKLIKELKE